MTVENEDYKLEILEYAINQSIDRLLPKSYEDALSVIFYKSNEVVWRVATEIYTRSGYQIDFSLVKSLLNYRIKPLRIKIAEEEKIKAELEAQRRIKQAEEEKIRREKETEEARIKAELEAKLKAERLVIEAEEQQILQQFKEANPDIDINSYRELVEFQEQKQLQQFKEAHPGIYIDNDQKLLEFIVVFEKLKNILVDKVEIKEELITLDCILFEWNYFGSRDNTDLDLIEFVMAIEEEFDIEIPDEEQESFWDCSFEKIINFVLQKV